MRKLINKIIIKFNKEKVKPRVGKKTGSFRSKEDYYICRVCKQIQTESHMDPEDISICNACSRRQ